MKFEFSDEEEVKPGPSSLNLVYTKMQEEIYLKSTAKYVICSAGRRSGKTAGAAQFIIDLALESHHKNFAWIEVSYSQVLAYYDRYFAPLLRKLPINLWSWNAQRRDLHILDNVISFRSSDREDLLVGLSYDYLFMNEAGIQLFESPLIWQQVLLPMMLDNPNSRAWLFGTPRGMVAKNGKENLFWTMFQKGLQGDPAYKSFKYTSYDNPFLSKEAIKELEEEVPPLLRAQELYAEFLNISELQIFKPEWWVVGDIKPEPHLICKTFISVDSAFSEKTTADESAASVWIKLWTGEFWCIDLWHGHLSYPDLVDKLKELITRHNPDNVVIENKASGQSLIQTFRNDLPHMCINKWPMDGVRMPDKVSRATSITSYLESGKVTLLRGHWNKDLINQATVFPVGDLDDCVDSCVQAILWAKMDISNANPFVTRKIQTSRLPDMAEASETIQSYSLRNPNHHRGF
jgi:predicted phage terminase large subunit-like protein